MEKKRSIGDIIETTFLALLLIILAIGMIYGGLKILDVEFVRYLVTISFVLAGFTFHSIFNNESDKRYYWIAQSCWAFILSGFFLIAYLLISNIGETSSKILKILATLVPVYLTMGLFCFIFGIVILVITLKIILNKLTDKHFDK